MATVVHKKLTGLVAATFTPFTPEGEVNISEIGPYIDYLKEKQGVNNLFGLKIFGPGKYCTLRPGGFIHFGQTHHLVGPVNGTTGESMSLTVAERKILAEEWCLKAKGKVDQLIVHVGCMSLKDTQELTRHAADIRADGIAIISPSFFKPRSADVLRKFLHEVTSVAPTMPVYYYHIPSVTGVDVLGRDVLEGIEELIPSFSGVKFSGSDLMDFGQCVSYSQPHWSCLYGVDEQLLGALAMGAHGAVGSTYNYMGSHFKELMAAFEQGDLVQARTIQFKLQELITYAKKLGFDLGVNKQLMIELSGLSLGPPRPPVMPCPQSLALSIAQKYHNLFPK